MRFPGRRHSPLFAPGSLYAVMQKTSTTSAEHRKIKDLKGRKRFGARCTLKALRLHFYLFLCILDCGLECFYTTSIFENMLSCRNATSAGDVVKCASIITDKM